MTRELRNIHFTWVASALVVVLACALCTSCAKTQVSEEELASQRFKFATLQASRGNCEEASDLVNLLPASFTYREDARRGVAAIRARCLLFNEGDIEGAESALDSAVENAANDPGVTLSSLMVAVRLHQCRFVDAVEWAYTAQEQRPRYRTNTALPWAAIAYALQGRSSLASRNAATFVSSYPDDWYRTTRSAPPAGVQYDQRSAHEQHQFRRAEMQLLRAALGGSPRLTEDDFEQIRLFLDSSRLLEAQGATPAYLDAKTAEFHAARESFILRGLLELEQRLRLSDTQVEQLLVRLNDAYANLVSLDSACGDVLNITRMDTLDILIDRGMQPDVTALADAEAASQLVEGLSRLSNDSDRDGIEDSLDACPEDPETFNGINDKDGCPDKEMASVRVEDNEIVFDESIQFETDSAELATNSLGTLDELVLLFEEYPGIRKVRIEGHTDERGAASYNLRLSQERVDAVVNYLVRAGIDRSRLTGIGYGETQPIAFGNNHEAWSQNRRVEMLLEDYDSPTGYKL